MKFDLNKKTLREVNNHLQNIYRKKNNRKYDLELPIYFIIQKTIFPRNDITLRTIEDNSIACDLFLFTLQFLRIQLRIF